MILNIYFQLPMTVPTVLVQVGSILLLIMVSNLFLCTVTRQQMEGVCCSYICLDL